MNTHEPEKENDAENFNLAEKARVDSPQNINGILDEHDEGKVINEGSVETDDSVKHILLTETTDTDCYDEDIPLSKEAVENAEEIKESEKLADSPDTLLEQSTHDNVKTESLEEDIDESFCNTENTYIEKAAIHSENEQEIDDKSSEYKEEVLAALNTSDLQVNTNVNADEREVDEHIEQEISCKTIEAEDKDKTLIAVDHKDDNEEDDEYDAEKYTNLSDSQIEEYASNLSKDILEAVESYLDTKIDLEKFLNVADNIENKATEEVKDSEKYDEEDPKDQNPEENVHEEIKFENESSSGQYVVESKSEIDETESKRSIEEHIEVHGQETVENQENPKLEINTEKYPSSLNDEMMIVVYAAIFVFLALIIFN